MSKNFDGVARLLLGGSLVAAAALLSGCMTSPTYGTDKTANAQLMSDVSGILSFRDKKKPPIDYTPRPELVKPAKGDETLPAPQDTVATASNPNWPESPEQRLARLRAEADANLDNPNYDSPIVPDMASSGRHGQVDKAAMAVPTKAACRMCRRPRPRRRNIKKRLHETQQGSSHDAQISERAADRLSAGRRRRADWRDSARTSTARNAA